MSCDDCFKGTLHEGTPVGKIEVFDGVETYVSLPTGDYDKSVAVLYLGDIYGFYNNAKLLCDGYAANGLATYFPDYFNGDPIPESAMNGGDFDRDAWRVKHTPEITQKPLDKAIEALKAKGITTFLAVGYCFGGKYAFDLAVANRVKVAAVAHPSGIVVPAGLDALFENSSVPVLFNACEIDKTVRPSLTRDWPKESQDAADAKLGGGAYKPGYKQNYYPGCTHGFGTRGDIKVPEQKFGKENAFEETVKWFKKYL
ncbi:dienelactone hydrolase endo-1,3,1,4-beta-D-glucanase [Pseudohyphozyma bogoriensis]|nr:dienelactone hydrolase endo-1,3,1,4-beta-D-glucanase [Pseudohyphozyma bogoriensis]